MNSLSMGGLIKKFRENQNMTQAALAERLGVSDKAVSKWETGKGYPDITIMEPLASLLGVSVSELMAGTSVENQNRGCNMNRCVFYVCPTCGNVLVGAGEAVVTCHGETLRPLQPQEPDDAHAIDIAQVEDEYFVCSNHPMTKDHFISFFAAVTDSGVMLTKCYPEGNAETRFKKNCTRAVYAYCTKHGLFQVSVRGKKPCKTETDYAQEVKERYGDTQAYRESEERRQSQTPQQRQGFDNGLMDLFRRFGEVKDQDPACDEAQKLVAELQQYITDHYYTCTMPILCGLGDVYASDDRFSQTIDDAGGEGTATFVACAIARFAGQL